MPNTLTRFACAVRSLARKWTPAVAFLLAGALLLTGREQLAELTKRVYHVTGAAGDNMQAAEVAADSLASGWLPFGLLTSKELAMAGTFVLLCILVWRMQRLITPGEARWVKKDSPTAFDRLPDAEKFRYYHQGRWQVIALVGIAAVFAALTL